jgi:hypothetical protein
LAVGGFISSHLAKVGASDDLQCASKVLPMPSSIRDSTLLDIREVLMLDPLTAPGDAVVLSCVRGVVTWKEYTTDTGYYHLHEQAPDAASASNYPMKKRKVSLRKCVIHIKDREFDDVLFLYLPDTLTAAAICLTHFEIACFNCKLKISANKRHVFLEYDINESSIGKWESS